MAITSHSTGPYSLDYVQKKTGLNFPATGSTQTREERPIVGLNWFKDARIGLPITGFQQFANTLFRSAAFPIESFLSNLWNNFILV